MRTLFNYRGSSLLAAALLLVCGSAASARDGQLPFGETPGTPYNIGFDQKLGDKVPLDLVFNDELGNPVSLKDCINGKPTILILAWYMCPGLCGEVLTGVMDACRKMKLTCGKDFNIVTVSIDPKEPPRLAFAKKMHFVTEYGRKEADAGWKFLTTTKDENIKQLAAAVGFRYEWDKMLKEFKHASGIVILTPEGIISRYFAGIEYLDRGDNGQLLQNQTKTLHLSLVEASDGEIGTATDRAFLSCFKFDRHRGKYSLDVLRIMQAGGLLTLLIIAGVFARVAWKLPGARLMVFGICVYVLLVLPVIMYTRFSLPWLPQWAVKLSIVPIGLILFFLGRWVWRSAKVRAPEPVPPVASV
jgi:protein SCO1/2